MTMKQSGSFLIASDVLRDVDLNVPPLSDRDPRRTPQALLGFVA